MSFLVSACVIIYRIKMLIKNLNLPNFQFGQRRVSFLHPLNLRALALLSVLLVLSMLVLEATLAIALLLSPSDVRIVLVISLFLPVPCLVQLSFVYNNVVNKITDVVDNFLSQISQIRTFLIKLICSSLSFE